VAQLFILTFLKKTPINNIKQLLIKKMSTKQKKHFHFTAEYLAIPGMIWIIMVIYLIINLLKG